MALYLISIGLDDEKDITLKGLDAVKKCSKVFLESYTSRLNCPIENLEILYGKKIIFAGRDIVETKADEIILDAAKEGDAALLVIGDALAATTHTDLILRAKRQKIEVNVIHNASVLNAVSETGLQLYKFGKTTSIPFPEKGFEPETAYDIIKENLAAKAHTLVLLDLRPNENRFMTVNDALKILLGIESRRREKTISDNLFVIGCARLASGSQDIFAGKLQDVIKHDFGKPIHCLVIPSGLHFMEKEYLDSIMGRLYSSAKN